MEIGQQEELEREMHLEQEEVVQQEEREHRREPRHEETWDVVTAAQTLETMKYYSLVNCVPQDAMDLPWVDQSGRWALTATANFCLSIEASTSNGHPARLAQAMLVYPDHAIVLLSDYEAELFLMLPPSSSPRAYQLHHMHGEPTQALLDACGAEALAALMMFNGRAVFRMRDEHGHQARQPDQRLLAGLETFLQQSKHPTIAAKALLEQRKTLSGFNESDLQGICTSL
jgi:hypothetical protein